MQLHAIMLILSSMAWAANPPAPDLQKGCGSELPAVQAEESCGDFNAHPNFRSSPEISKARQACEAFYQRSWEANHLICSFANYVKWIKTAKGPSLPEIDRTRRAEFLDAFRKQHQALERTTFEFQREIGRVNTAGLAAAHLEISCGFAANREKPGPVASMMLVGLAQKAQLDLNLNQGVIREAIRDTARLLHLSKDKGEIASRSIPLVENNAEPTVEGKVQAPEAPEDSEPDTTYLFWALNSTAQYYAEQYGDAFLSKWAKQVFRQYPKAARKVPRLARYIPEYAGTVAAAGLAIGAQYVVTGKVSALDLISIGVTAYSFGAGLMIDIAIGAYKDNQEKRRAFAEFAQTHLKEKPASTSAQLAWAWAEEKEKYCGVADPHSKDTPPPRLTKQERKAKKEAEKKKENEEDDEEED